MKLFHKGDKPAKDIAEIFGSEAEEESYRRYKHRCYRNLIFKSLLSFLLGLFGAAILKLI